MPAIPTKQLKGKMLLYKLLLNEIFSPDSDKNKKPYNGMGVCTHAYSLGNINTRICCHSYLIKDFRGNNYFELS